MLKIFLIGLGFLIAFGLVVAWEWNSNFSFTPVVSNDDRDSLNALFLSSAPKEFFGYFDYYDGSSVGGFRFVGTRSVDGSEIDVVGVMKKGAPSVHSHPDGVCMPSGNDEVSARILGEPFYCIVCGPDQFACFKVSG